MKFKIIISLAAAAVVIITLWLLFFNKEENSDIIITPNFGKFDVTVTTTGELQAKNSVEIRGPGQVQTIGIYQMKISKLVPEGTVVDSGDFVAELDKTDIMSKIKDAELNIEKQRSKLKQSKLDSSLTLSQARDDIENLKFNLEEKKLLIKQSKYEPPATKRQAEIDYEKAERAYNQAVKNYKTKVQKAVTGIQIINTDLSKEIQKLNKLKDLMKRFTIRAPAAGMVIYERQWDGRRKTVGSTIRAWHPTVAELPDLTKMESITYVNEVDIQKVEKEQKVKIGLDADPDKKLTGVVERVANIGGQRQNSDSKVFEVVVTVNEKDTTLRPAMTTSNEILVASKDSALYIPLECVHTKNDTTFVYKHNGGEPVKQQVELGLISENEAEIKKGLKRGDEIYLSIPTKYEKAEKMAIKEPE